MMANLGRSRLEPSPRFTRVSSRVRTAVSLVSLPAAEMVRMAPTGSVCSTGRFRSQKSHRSPSGLAAPRAMALAASMTLPPPTARTRSAPKSNAFWTPSRT